MKNHTPQAEIKNGQLVISIGVSALAAGNFGSFNTTQKTTSIQPPDFAARIATALNKTNLEGSTPIERIFNEAADEAVLEWEFDNEQREAEAARAEEQASENAQASQAE